MGINARNQHVSNTFTGSALAEEVIEQIPDLLVEPSSTLPLPLGSILREIVPKPEIYGIAIETIKEEGA
jgi:hypothetical protein